MGINNLGYRQWRLKPKNNGGQWRTIASFGIRVAWRSKWLQRIFIAAWIPVFVMGFILFIVEQSIQDIDSNDFPENIGRFAVSGFVYQRPEIRNLMELTQISKLANGVNDLFSNFLERDKEEAGNVPSIKGARQFMRSGIDFKIKDLQFISNMSEQQLQAALTFINNKNLNTLRRSIQLDRRGPPVPSYKLSMEKITYSQTVAKELIDYDLNNSEVIEFAELVDYLRPTLWSEVLFLFLGLPQAFSVIILIGMIAPKLISRDMKNRSFLLYYSRPIAPSQYLLGKCAIVWAFLAGLTTMPALLLYIVGISLSPDISVLYVTWTLPIKIIVASMILCIPTTLFALMLSSLTRESRLASFGWFSIWILGQLGYELLTWMETEFRVTMNANDSVNTLASSKSLFEAEARQAGNWSWLSPMKTLENLQSSVFGIDREVGNIDVSFLVVGIVCIACLAILRRRITSPIRV
ncbi:MAG: ABC transporter permease subunit [Planctomycetota bacterium]|nr:ABC transporter permease subunit [Planctomycetota bacterium]